MREIDFPLTRHLSDDEVETLLENWDRFQAIETALLAASTLARGNTPEWMTLKTAMEVTVSEANWKKELLQRQAARTTSGRTP